MHNSPVNRPQFSYFYTPQTSISQFFQSNFQCLTVDEQQYLDYKLYNQKVQRMGCGVSEDNLKTVALPSNDRYERRELIGVGHHGRVYKSFYQLDKKQYANKVIDQFRPNTNLLKVQTACSQLINRLKKLRNDKIATYNQIDFTEKEVSIIMELSKEGTLKKYIQKNGKLSQETASIFAESILQALDYLHNAGVLHKDLKSTNVLVMPKNEIKVSDYGIAEIYDDRLTEKDSKGMINREIDYYRGDSLPYMAPEVIKNIEIIDKSDVWSLGCIVVEMITGQTPWNNVGENFEQAFQIISNVAIPPLPKNISKECQSFLESCLAVIPTQRLSVRDLLSHKFIKKHSKDTSLFFEEDTSLDNIRVTLQNSDKINRVQQKPAKNEKLQHYLNDSLNLKNVERHDNNSAVVASKKQSRQDRKEKMTRDIDDNIVKIREALHSIDTKKLSKQSPQDKEEVKPIVNQDELHTVILNNKKVQLDPARYKINGPARKMKTEENQWNSPPRNKSRVKHSIQVEKLNFDTSKQYYDPFKNHNSSHFEDSLDTEVRLKNMRLETQPNISEYSDRQYFKRPLKLLKKKLKEGKESYDFSRKLTSDVSKTAMKNDLLKLQEDDIEEEDLHPLTKIRVYTESKREERVIDTELARAERDRYLTQQKAMKRLREEQKNKWEEQLKKGAEILKDQLKRYYYNPLAS